MANNPIKRMSRQILGTTVAPLLRLSFHPLVRELGSRFENIEAQLAAQRAQTTADVDRMIAAADAAKAALERLAPMLDCIASRSHSGNSERARSRAAQPQLRNEIAALRTSMARQTPDNPCIHGFKVFAQTDEDGIIQNILDRLPGHSKTFIEIGCGNGLENNTHYLLLKNYRGAWVDDGDESIAFIENALGGLQFNDLLVKKNFVARENVAALINELCDFIGTTELGFFSLDIDGNDIHVLAECLKCFRPVTICVEYNAKFPPPLQLAMRYDPAHRWAGDDYHGASLQSFCDLLVDYKLVACNLTGVNAFFVRRDQAGAFPDCPAGQLYQPFREELIDLRAEHRPSLKWLRDILAEGGNREQVGAP